MASTRIPRKPEDLCQYLRRIEVGDDKHKKDRPLKGDARPMVEGARTRLEFAMKRLQFAEGELASAKKFLRDETKFATHVADRARAGVRSIWGGRSPVVIDYGLKPIKSGRPKGSRNR